MLSIHTNNIEPSQAIGQPVASFVEELLGKGIGFRSLLHGTINTTTASGELMFHIFSSLAQFKRRLVQERTHASLAAARTRGRLGGQRPVRADDPRVVTVKRLHQDRSLSVGEICATLNISRPTFYRYLSLPDPPGKDHRTRGLDVAPAQHERSLGSRR